jgi:thioredoxin 1
MAKQRQRASQKIRIRDIAVAFALILLVVLVFACRQKKDPPAASDSNTASSQGSLNAEIEKTSQPQTRLPLLVDLGADKCIPCKMMAPILEELKKEYAGRLRVEFIDVWKNPKAGRQYGIRIIPTQIFYDTDGKEFYRHQGFIARDDILAIFREKGVDLSGGKEQILQ